MTPDESREVLKVFRSTGLYFTTQPHMPFESDANDFFLFANDRSEGNQLIDSVNRARGGIIKRTARQFGNFAMKSDKTAVPPIECVRAIKMDSRSWKMFIVDPRHH